jgi:hypothetical protein
MNQHIKNANRRKEEDNEELQHDVSETNYTYESLIEQWFQADTRLKSFSFSFSFDNLEFQQFSNYLLYIHVYSRLSFVKLEENICILLLREWFHWKFDYT